jgi:hypothetical protein
MNKRVPGRAPTGGGRIALSPLLAPPLPFPMTGFDLSTVTVFFNPLLLKFWMDASNALRSSETGGRGEEAS